MERFVNSYGLDCWRILKSFQIAELIRFGWNILKIETIIQHIYDKTIHIILPWKEVDIWTRFDIILRQAGIGIMDVACFVWQYSKSKHYLLVMIDQAEYIKYVGTESIVTLSLTPSIVTRCSHCQIVHKLPCWLPTDYPRVSSCLVITH